MRRPQKNNLGSGLYISRSCFAYRAIQGTFLKAECHVGNVGGVVVIYREQEGRSTEASEVILEFAGIDGNTHNSNPTLHFRRIEGQVA